MYVYYILGGLVHVYRVFKMPRTSHISNSCGAIYVYV